MHFSVPVGFGRLILLFTDEYLSPEKVTLPYYYSDICIPGLYMDITQLSVLHKFLLAFSLQTEIFTGVAGQLLALLHFFNILNIQQNKDSKRRLLFSN